MGKGTGGELVQVFGRLQRHREREVRGGVGGVCTLTASEWKESSGSDATGISACWTFVSSGINTRDLFISNVEMVASSHSGNEC